MNTCGNTFPVYKIIHWITPPVVIAHEAGDYSIATSMVQPEPCQVYE